MNTLPESSIDLIFADPPYNLQLTRKLWRPNMTKVEAVDDGWDRFGSFQEYDAFSKDWLLACRRVLKDTGTIWVIGTYHNIFRLGTIMQDLGYWFLNDIVWVKTNPMPNFRGVRFTNAHETLLWASKFKGARYTFNHHTMKALNDGKQMRSDWIIPICSGSERLRVDGKKVHSTQKPEALLYRILLASTLPGDVVLDPFFGTGTTGAVARRSKRRWIGIERESEYITAAYDRLASIPEPEGDVELYMPTNSRRSRPRVNFVKLLEHGLLRPGKQLYFRRDRDKAAIVHVDGSLLLGDHTGSIHQVGRYLMGGSPCNGWEHWFYEDPEGKLCPINDLREILWQDYASFPSDLDPTGNP